MKSPVDKEKMMKDFVKTFGKKEPLHPDLEKCRDEFGIRHPYVYSLFHTDFQNAIVNKQYATKKREIKEAFRDKRWSSYIWLHEKPYRFNAFTDICPSLSDQEYWELLSSIWVDSENIWQNLRAWKSLLSCERPGREFMMDESEREVFLALPHKVRVYRGCQRHNVNGLSYTLDLEKAAWFARRYARKEGMVTQKIVAKESIIAYLDGRGEKEVIVL